MIGIRPTAMGFYRGERLGSTPNTVGIYSWLRLSARRAEDGKLERKIRVNRAYG